MIKKIGIVLFCMSTLSCANVPVEEEEQIDYLTPPNVEKQLVVTCLMGDCRAENLALAIADLNIRYQVELLVYGGNATPGFYYYEDNVIPVIAIRNMNQAYHMKDTPEWGVSFSSAALEDTEAIQEGLVSFIDKFF